MNKVTSKVINKVFSIEAVNVVLKGFKICVAERAAREPRDTAVSERLQAHAALQVQTMQVLQCAVDACTKKDTGIVVEASEEGFRAIHQALSYAISAHHRSKPSTVKKIQFSKVYRDVAGKCDSAVAEYRYSGKCQYCGKVPSEPSTLLHNNGACMKPRCILQAMRDSL